MYGYYAQTTMYGQILGYKFTKQIYFQNGLFSTQEINEHSNSIENMNDRLQKLWACKEVLVNAFFNSYWHDSVC